MKKLSLVLLAALIIFLTASRVQAERIGPFDLTPLNPIFVVSGPWDPACTLVADPDVWIFDFAGFSSPVALTLRVSDAQPELPDDYNLSWDGVLLGNTETASPGRLFNFATSPVRHELTVAYANLYSGSPPASGGSYYILSLEASPAPLPAAVLLLGAALLRLWGARKKFMQ